MDVKKCPPGFYTIYCIPCECGSGEFCFDGASGNGSCYCPTYNAYICNRTDYNPQNLTIINNETFINQTIFLGNTSVENGYLSLQSSDLSTLNFFLNNSTIQINLNSSITILGCFQASNSTIIIDLNSTIINNTTLFKFNATCSNISKLNYQFLNQPDKSLCPTIVNQVASIYIFIKSCSENNNNTLGTQNDWIVIVIIVVISVIVVGVTIIILIFAVPSIKSKIFPHSEKYPNRNKRKEKIIEEY